MRAEGKEHNLGTREGSTKFCQNWKDKNANFISYHFGLPEQRRQFIDGILFATSMSKVTTSSIQYVIQADAAHMNFGKYTLYSAYGSTADAGCSPIAFGMMFGNEDAAGWSRFWQFAKSSHPWLDDNEKLTIITDQDKGSASAIASVLPRAGNFHCSFHRRMNIIKNCKNKSKSEYKALQVYDSLLSAKNMTVFNERKDLLYKSMDPDDKVYLMKVADDMQYPAPRCATDCGVYMLGRTSSASVESMNAANKSVRDRTGVDLVNATILLLQLEKNRFDSQKAKVWTHSGVLTPKGRELSSHCAMSVTNHRDYSITCIEHERYNEYKVCR